jgi:hypothetical protein
VVPVTRTGNGQRTVTLTAPTGGGEGSAGRPDASDAVRSTRRGQAGRGRARPRCHARGGAVPPPLSVRAGLGRHCQACAAGPGSGTGSPRAEAVRLPRTAQPLTGGDECAYDGRSGAHVIPFAFPNPREALEPRPRVRSPRSLWALPLVRCRAIHMRRSALSSLVTGVLRPRNEVGERTGERDVYNDCG